MRRLLPFISVGWITWASPVKVGATNFGDGWSVSFVNESLDEASGDGLSCRERILGRVSIPRGAGSRQIRSVWFRPDGSVEQESSFTARLAADRTGQAVVWLQLHPGARGIFGDFTLGDFGGVDHPFNGVWRFEMYEEGHFILRERFDVSCVD